MHFLFQSLISSYLFIFLYISISLRMKHEKLINMIDYETTGNHKKKYKKI